MQIPVGLVVLILVVVLAVLVWRALVRIVTVHDYERGLRFRNGRLVGLVASGAHVSIRPLSEIHVLDGRPTTLVIDGQEVMTADGVPLKLSLAVRYVVADPVAAITGDADFRRALYVTLQLALRDVVVSRTVEETLGARREIGPAVREASASGLAELGVELLAVELRDAMLPGELKRAYASVLAARKDGEAALERARGETASLRNLANAGRMVEDNPGLLQLRVLQELGASSGNTVMLGMPDGVAAPATAPRRGRARPAPSTPEGE